MTVAEPIAPRRSRWAGLAGAMLKVGSIGFGGGSALIPVFDDEFVRGRRVVDETTFTRQTVVASVTPGALPVKLAGLIGLELGGARLAALLAVVVAVPGTALTLLLLATLSSADAGVLRYVELAAVGINAFIIALLVHYVVAVCRTSSRRTTAVLITVATALATGTPAIAGLLGVSIGRTWRVDVPQLTAVQVIGLALAAVLVRSVLRRRVGTATLAPGGVSRPAPAQWRPAMRTAILLVALGLIGTVVVAVVATAREVEFLGLVAASTISSFGGGEAYVGVADGFFVAGGFVDPGAYYTQLVPIANALPGPILVKLVAAIGFVAAGGGPAGWLLGTTSALVAIATCTAIAVALMAAYDRLSTSPLLTDVATYLLPVIAGMLVSTMAAMLGSSATTADQAHAPAALVVWASALAAGLVLYLRARRRVPDLMLIAVCAAASTAGLLLV